MAAKSLEEQVGKMKLILQVLKYPYSLDFTMSIYDCEAKFHILASHDDKFKLERLMKSIKDICDNHTLSVQDDIQTDQVNLMNGRTFDVVKSRNIKVDLVIRG